MESAHITETVQAVSSASEDMTAPHTKDIDPQISIPGGCESFDASPVDDDPSPSAKAEGTDKADSGAGANVTKGDLVSLLEGFVRIIKTDEAALAAVAGTGIQLSRGGLATVSQAKVDDRTAEIDQLRGLVIEAQDTIIKLLTDRVDDRSRIAALEAQLNLVPDLQAQADRAMSVAVRTDEYRTELTKMKFELDRFRLFRVRVEAEQKKGWIFNRIQKWLFSRPSAIDETQQRNNYQKMVGETGSFPNIQPVTRAPAEPTNT